MWEKVGLVLLGVLIKEGFDWWKSRGKKKKAPKLRLVFDDKTPQTFDRVRGISLDGPVYKEMYVRVGVTNDRTDVAKDVRAYLVKVETLDGKPTDFHDSLPLIWSADTSIDSVPLQKGVIRHFDVVILSEGQKGFDMQFLGNGQKLYVNGYDPIFSQATGLKLTVLCGGENCEPATKTLRIENDGAWPPKIQAE